MPDNSELTARTGEILEVLAGVQEKHPLTLAGIHSIRSEAVKKVADEREIDTRTVADKCWRGLGLASISEFDDLLWGWLNRGDTELRNLVLARIPSDATDADGRAVEQFFSEKKRLNVWWVNQGSTWKQETEGGYVWAPKTNKAGHAQGHHQSVNRLRENDVIFHHWGGQIRGVSRVITDGAEGTRPGELPSDVWESEGFIGRVDYLPFDQPISTQLIPLEWRVEEDYAFNINGGVNQNYLVPLSLKFWAGLITQFKDHIPTEIDSVLVRVTCPR